MNRELTEINIEKLKESIKSYEEMIKAIKGDTKKKINLLKLAIKDKEKEIKYNKKISKL